MIKICQRLATLTLVLLLANGCKKREYISVDTDDANLLAKSLTYLRDPRTGLCFAYFFETRGDHQGGPALANVPCERVEHLINNGAERAPGN
jgi:hypothetical protein